LPTVKKFRTGTTIYPATLAFFYANIPPVPSPLKGALP
jgi:hypothetical protein